MQPQTDLPGYDDAALANLYQRHAYTLLNFIRRYVSTREDAEDVLLEAFLAAMERHSLRGLSSEELNGAARKAGRHEAVPPACSV